jgi:hypothetical protein
MKCGLLPPIACRNISSVISTRDLSALPSILKLKRLTQSLAALDAIIEPTRECRYYSFNNKWDAAEQMASMRDGCGDEWFCVFSKVGAFLKGFDHESPMSPWNFDPKIVWAGVLDQVPKAFERFANEPAFSVEDTTFCIWRSHTDNSWRKGNIEFPTDYDDPDGSAELLSILEGEPRQYRLWAESYYERSVPLALVEHTYQHKVLTEDVIRSLNPGRDFETLATDIAEIGYPEP